MSFMSEEGFCCTFVESWTCESEFDARVWDFLSWVKSLPAYSGHYGGYPTTSTATTLTDQPYVIKIVEDGYAFMFRGAFAPKGEQAEEAGYDRIPYFELINSQFKEMEFSGDACVVAVCGAHGKRYLLNIYLKDPPLNDMGLTLSEESQASTDSGGQATDETDSVHTATDKAEATDLVRTEDSPKGTEALSCRKQPIYIFSHADAWTWV